MKILFTGGGTGGHVFPIIAIYREMVNLSTDRKHRFYYMGPKDEASLTYLTKEDIDVSFISAGKIRRYIDFKSVLLNIVDILFKIPLGFFQSFFRIFFLAPDVIFSKGGYGSLPVIIAGWILGTPIFLHESDAVPGVANKFLSRFALGIFSSFPAGKTKYFALDTITIGNPIRSSVLHGSLNEAKEIFKLTGERPVILVLGGSQGSQRINDVILQVLSSMLQKYELIHQCGTKNFQTIKAESEVVIKKELNKYYHLYPFLDEKELAAAYSAATLIVSRAGSGSIFEIAAVNKPSMIVPLPESAQNHQVENAYSYAKNGACIVIEELNFTPHFFLDRLNYLISHQDEMDSMTESTKKFVKPRAAEIIAAYLTDYLKL